MRGVAKAGMKFLPKLFPGKKSELSYKAGERRMTFSLELLVRSLPGYRSGSYRHSVRFENKTLASLRTALSPEAARQVWSHFPKREAIGTLKR